MKDFNEFKNSFSGDELNQICNSRIEKIKEFEKELRFESPSENLNWVQRSLTIGLIFDFLEEYHKWLNS